MHRKEYDGARKTLASGIKQLAGKEKEIVLLQRASVQLDLAQGEFDAAHGGLVQLYAADENDPQPLYLLLELALRRGKLTEAAQWETKLRQTEGHVSTLGRYYRVWRLVASAVDASDPRLSQAVTEQTILSRERPNWPLTYFAVALVHEKLGDFAKASDALETAIQLGDTRASSFERLVRVLSLQGRFAEADVYLKRLERLIPDSTRLSSLAILVAAQLDDIDRATKLARDGVEHRPQDAMAWLWLGQVLLAQKKHEEAEQACRKAQELAPADARTWNGLFTCCIRTGRSDEARQMLAELPEQVSLPVADIAFVQAQGYELLGDREAAKRHYAVAENAAPDHFPLQMRIANFYLAEDSAHAEKALRKALELNRSSGSARRMLAAVLAGDPDRWGEAVRLLSEGSETADERVQAALLAMRRSEDRVNDLEASRQILERLVLHATNPSDVDRLLLALVYAELSKVQLTAAARDNLASFARAQFRPLLVGRSQLNQAHLAVYIRFLLDRDSLDEAQRWLAVLERESPDSLLFVSLQARWLHAAGDEQKIEPLVESIATKRLETLESDGEKLKLLASIGQIYARVENHAAAQRWFDRLAATDAQRFGPLAMSLTAQGQPEAAVDLCLQAAKNNDSPLPALVLARVLTGAPEYQPPVEVEQLLAAAIKSYPQDANLLTAMANLRLVQGNPPAAISLYREIVNLRPRDPVVLNNLATLLTDDVSRAPRR